MQDNKLKLMAEAAQHIFHRAPHDLQENSLQNLLCGLSALAEMAAYFVSSACLRRPDYPFSHKRC